VNEYRFNVVKEERKALVAAISDIVGCKAKYMGALGFAFTVDTYTISANGTVTAQDDAGVDSPSNLLAQLAERGYVYEAEPVEAENEDESSNLPQDEDLSDEVEPANECTALTIIPEESQAEDDGTADDANPVPAPNPNVYETVDADPNAGANVAEDTGSNNNAASAVDTSEDAGILSIDMPLYGINSTVIENLEKLVASKAWILKKMTGAESLTIEEFGGRLRFPWFKPDSSAKEIDAYSRLVTRLCETAKEKKRVMAEEKLPRPGDNEKYKARCFLLSLDFKGSEYSQARKILLSPFPGNGSFLQGSSKKETDPVPVTDDGEASEAISEGE